MPKISVIVPVFNTEEYLHRCVDSILAQTFTDFEMLLVNDGSDDNSGAICDDYQRKDNRVVVFHQQNKGQAAARNLALDWVFANSDSEFISFVDSDDWVHPQYLELLLSAIQSFQVNISQCLHIETDDNKFVHYYEPIVYANTACISPEEQYIQFYSAFMWDKLFRRSCWENMRFPEGQIYEDVAISYKLLFAETNIAIVKKPLYYYSVNQNSTVHSDWTTAKLAQVNAWEEQLHFFEKRGDEELLGCAAVHYFQISNSQLEAVEESTAISESDRKKYQRLLRNKIRRILFHFRKIKSFVEQESWAYGMFFPKLAWLYWTYIGLKSKLFR